MWYNDASLVRNFGIALSNAEVLEDNEDFAAFLAKPQRYNEEFDIWQQNGYPASDGEDGWDEFVDGITEDAEAE